MADPPLVSIVMPARNAAATIAAAIDSVRAQTVTDWQLIIIDDGSTDYTAALVTAMVQDDRRIRLIHGPGEGAAAARNRGLFQATGRWLAFLDADDWWAEDFLARMLAALTGAPGGSIAYCGYRRVMPDGGMTEARIDDTLAKAPFETFARTCAVVTIHCLLMDRQRVADAGGFDTSLVTCEDWDLWQRLSRAGAHWVMLDRPLCYYRQSPGSLTRRTRQMLIDGRRVIDRAFEPDPRVASPLPQFADGIARDSMGQTADQAYAWFALWCAVVGWTPNDPRPLDPAILAHLEREPHWVPAIADTIVQGIEVRTCAVRAAMFADWDDIRAEVEQVAAAIAQGWGAPQRAVHLCNAVRELLVGAASDERLPVTLDNVQRVALAWNAPGPILVGPGVDRLMIDIRAGDRPAGRILLGVLGSLSASRVGALVADGIAPDTLPHLMARATSWSALPAIARRLARSGNWLDRGALGRAWRQHAAARAMLPNTAPADDHGAALQALGAIGDPESARRIVPGGARRDLPLILFDDALSLETVERHLTWLATSGATALSMDAVAAHQRSGRRFPRRGVALAFQARGPDDLARIAAMLDGAGLAATAFLPVDAPFTPRDDGPLLRGLALDAVDIPFTLDTPTLARHLIRGRSEGGATALLAPRSGCDDRLAQLAVDCGYNAMLTNRVGYVQLSGHPMQLPVIQAADGWTMGRVGEILEYQR
ncbi:glycosyltransferase family 2 protein [Sphingomonas sp. FW199]|uniref:glycosyltransferase family 2 protein n=1 Tax=Sphingomonas sp. FW199 TaxID=3400217 RepID=UPI003CEFA5EA